VYYILSNCVKTVLLGVKIQDLKATNSRMKVACINLIQPPYIKLHLSIFYIKEYKGLLVQHNFLFSLLFSVLPLTIQSIVQAMF